LARKTPLKKPNRGEEIVDPTLRNPGLATDCSVHQNYCTGRITILKLGC